MNEVKMCMDHIKYRSKPEGSEVGKISNRIAKKNRVFTIDKIGKYKEFAELVGENGVTFSPATYRNETRSTANFEQMQFLTLDFDSGISLEEVINRCREYDIPAFMAYETLSSEGQNKFRVIFHNNTPINDKRLAKIVLNSLHMIFPEADQKCNDISKMFFGGKKLLHFDESLPILEPESILRNMTYYLKNKKGYKHYKEYVKKFATKHGIKLTNKGLLDISIADQHTEDLGTFENGENLPNAILLISHHGKNSPNSYFQLNLDDDGTKFSVIDNKPKYRSIYRSDVLPELSRQCQLFREFDSGERRLSHYELFGISTNMIYIESGSDAFKATLAKHPDYYNPSKQERFGYYLQYSKSQEYNPPNCELFCPYHNTCRHGKNILSTIKPKRGTMERSANYEETLYPIEEVQDDLSQKLLQAIASHDKCWHIVKAQTAAGKSEAFLELMKTTGLRLLIAVPTNKLKQDIRNRAAEKGLTFIVTPSLDEIKDEMPANVWSHICNLRHTGQHKKVHTYISRMAEDKNIKCLKEYMEKQKKYEEHEGHTITTHRRFLNMSEKALAKYDVVILDEDIIASSIAPNQCEIPISSLKKIRKAASLTRLKAPIHNRLIKKIDGLMKAIKTETMFKLEPFAWDDDAEGDDAENEKKDADGISALTDIPSFCWAEHFIYRKASEERNLSEDCIVFLKPWRFKNIKHIMVSATVDKDVCEYVFGKENVKFYECKRAAYKGTLNQYPGKSMSRTYIDKNKGILDKIKEWSGFPNMITFKKYAIGDMYFGNAIGCDHLKGQDIDVVGTPYQVDFLYKLLPFTLGLHVDCKAMMKTCKITHNGYIFHFTTFGEEHEALRQFHLWMIESELEQAVGRARLLRCDCTVNLFSNFPLRQAVMKEAGYPWS